MNELAIALTLIKLKEIYLGRTITSIKYDEELEEFFVVLDDGTEMGV